MGLISRVSSRTYRRLRKKFMIRAFQRLKLSAKPITNGTKRTKVTKLNLPTKEEKDNKMKRGANNKHNPLRHPRHLKGKEIGLWYAAQGGENRYQRKSQLDIDERLVFSFKPKHRDMIYE